MKNFLKSLILLSTCLPLLAAAPFEYAPVLTNLINMSIATNVPGAGLLPANRVTAFLGGMTTTNQQPYSGFYIFMADSVKATNSPVIGGTNVFRSIYWDTKTSQTSTGRWEQVSLDIALADVITAGGPIGSATTVPIITYDAKGRLVNVTSTTITGVVPGGAAGGDLSGTYPNPTVDKLDGATVPAAGALTTGNVLQVNGASSLTYAPVNLAGGANYVTGTLPTAFGGTGFNGWSLGGIPVGTLAGTLFEVVGNTTTTPKFLTQTGNGAISAYPTWASLSFTNFGSGILSVTNGGTGAGTYTLNGVLYGQGTSPIAATAQGGANTVLVANSGAPAFSAAITVGTSVTTPALIATTSLTTPAATISGLTAARFALVDTGGLISTDSDFTWATDTATFTKVVAPTSMSSPLHISTGAITSLPAAGSNFDVQLSGAGNFTVNAGNSGFRTTSPDAGISIQRVGAAINSELSFKNQSGLTVDSIGVDGSVDNGMLFGSQSGFTFYAGGNPVMGSYPAGTGIVKINSSGYVGIGTTTGLAMLSVADGVHVGGDSNPGANNLTVDGATLTTTLTITSGTVLSNANASTAAVFDSGKALISSVTTLAELAFVSGVTSSIQTQLSGKVFTPLYGTVDPNSGTPVTGTGDGQLYMNTATGEKWNWYASGAYWTP